MPLRIFYNVSSSVKLIGEKNCKSPETLFEIPEISGRLPLAGIFFFYQVWTSEDFINKAEELFDVVLQG